MFGSQALRKIFIGSTALISVSVLNPTAARAVLPCPSNITDSSLAGVVCAFDAGSSVTVSNAGNVGGLSMVGYNPVAPSFIVNNGTIAGTIADAISVSSSALSGGITNNGHISSASGSGIHIFSSTINGSISNKGSIASFGPGIDVENSAVDGIANSGSIAPASGTGIRINAGSIGGSITNTGTITGGGLDDGIAILNSTEINGSITNDGTIQATGAGDGLFIRSSSTIVHGIVNAGIIHGGGDGVDILNTSIVQGDFDNSGTITGGLTAFSLHNGSTINGSLNNDTNGRISGGNTGINVFSASNINGAIVNKGVISGGNTGIRVSSTAAISGGIQNHGTIEGGTNAIFISADSTVADIDLFSGGNIIGAIDAPNTTLNIFGGQIMGAVNVNQINITGDFSPQNDLTLQGNLTVGNGGELTVRAGGTVMATGSLFTNAGTVHISVGSNISVGSFDAATAGTYIYDAGTLPGLGTNVQTGGINFGASAADLSHQTVAVNVVGGPFRTTYANEIARGTGAATGPAAVTDNSYIYDFTVVQLGGFNNILFLQPVLALAPSAAGDSSRNDTISDVLMNNLLLTNDPAVIGIQSNLASAPNARAYNNVLNSVVSDTDQSAMNGALSLMHDAFDAVDDQFSVFGADGQTGVGAGDISKGLHAWGQAVGSHLDQQGRGSVAGYDANVGGGLVGVDTRNAGEDDIAGFSLGYGHTDGNGDDPNSTHVGADTYQGMVYGNHRFDSNLFTTGMVAFGWDQNNQTRHDIGAVTALDANADYDSWQAALRWDVGRHFRDLSTGMTLTPSAGIDYFHYNAEGYTESGAGAAGLRVDSAHADMLDLGLAVRAEWLFRNADGAVIRPELHAGYKYQALSSDHIDKTGQLIGGGGAFMIDGLNPANSTFNIGAGVKLYKTTNWNFSATYDFTAKSDYTAHTGWLRAAYNF